MGTWAEDPELLATFRAEVEERLASLSAGLLQLESNASPRQLIAGLFRDAHTVKGSARMMGLTAVLQTAHAAEDLLGALRDGRFEVRRDYVDLLLATVDGISRSIASNPTPAVDEYLTELVNALRGALEGDDPVTIPRMSQPSPPAPEPHTAPPVVPRGRKRTLIVPAPPTVAAPPTLDAPPSLTVSLPAPPAAVNAAVPLVDGGGERAVDSVRVTSQRVYDLLDVVGEAELDARRVEHRLAADAPGHVKFLTDGQLKEFLEAVQGDSRTNVLAAPKLMVLNGQAATINITDRHLFLTGVDMVKAGGQISFAPKNEAVPVGLRMSVQPVVSADRRSVYLNLKVNQTDLASGAVPLFPVTVPVKPASGDEAAPGKPVVLTQFIQQPTLNTVAVDQTLTIPDGGTAVLSGWTKVTEAHTRLQHARAEQGAVRQPPLPERRHRKRDAASVRAGDAAHHRPRGGRDARRRRPRRLPRLGTCRPAATAAGTEEQEHARGVETTTPTAR